MVTAAHLHAALDFVLEIDEMIGLMHFPMPICAESRMRALTLELRELFVAALRSAVRVAR